MPEEPRDDAGRIPPDAAANNADTATENAEPAEPAADSDGVTGRGRSCRIVSGGQEHYSRAGHRQQPQPPAEARRLPAVAEGAH